LTSNSVLYLEGLLASLVILLPKRNMHVDLYMCVQSSFYGTVYIVSTLY
jgi:hypothetical protein